MQQSNNKSIKKLILILNTDQEYIRHISNKSGLYPAQENKLFQSISDIYLPLLNTFENLERENISFKISLVFTPILCTLLDDICIQTKYIEWLDLRIELGKKEIERCRNNPAAFERAGLILQKFEKNKLDFSRYGNKIIKKFREFHKKGNIEFLATCATNIFLPHYSDITKIISAQVETGIHAHKAFFGEMPEGFWLPELGYQNGIEKIIRSYGINYIIINGQSFLFSKQEPQNGIFTPARFDNSLVVFANDLESENEIFGSEGFSENKNYLNTERDIGFELSNEYLEPIIPKNSQRYNLGYCYWNKDEAVKENQNNFSPHETDGIYNYNIALQQCCKDAQIFMEKKYEKLCKAQALLPDCSSVSLVVTIDSSKFISHWHEGVTWIENLFRCTAESHAFNFEHPRNLLSNQFNLQKISPYYGSASGLGYGENLLSSKNNWMIRHVRKASIRMIDLAARFPLETGLRQRLLNLGAKELMLAQSCGWAKMIDEGDFPEYAQMRFKQSIDDFTAVFDALGTNTVSTEWLTALETEHPIFPWLNYRLFCRK